MLNLPLLLAQLLVVLTAARAAGWIARRLGQPEVVGEMAAGLALGPSLFGAVAPQAFESLFPARAIGPLATLSQLGVLLFMFVVGLRLDLNVLRGRKGAALATSHASIVVPFLLGLVVAGRLGPEFVGPAARGPAFALFVGAAMSVTAFPVLARILTERGLLHTREGAVAIASAAVDDVSAWCLLAVVLAVAKAGDGVRSGVTAVAGVTAYAAFVVLVARPVLCRLFAAEDQEPTPSQVGLATLVGLASALATESLGVHALFGAFLAGAVLPRHGDFARRVAERLDVAVTTVLLPIFFAFSGLRADLGPAGATAWSAFAMILAAAVVGKAGASTIAARLTGLSWREAFSVGALMNTRGLMELAILNVGLDVGVISPPLFAVMAVMALVTTAMTSPLLALSGLRAPRVVAAP